MKVEPIMYDLCYKDKHGKVKTLEECVTLKRGIAALRKFDRLVNSDAPVVKGVLYMFMIPVLTKK